MRHVVASVALLVLVSPALAQAPKGRKVAFLVGVNAYKFNFPDLGTAPERDVTELARTLSAGGFEVVMLTGSADGAAKATKKNLEARFVALLNGDGNADRALGKNDLILIHLCGHGFQAEATNDDGKKEEQPFFCPVDALPGKPESMVSLNKLIAETEPRGVTALFLVDACREVADPNRGNRGGVQGNKVTLRKNTAVLFACGQGQLSHQSERAGGGHGLFTFAVLKTIRSNIAGGGRVSWSQLVSGVEESFQSDEFRKMLPVGQRQSPVEAKGELGFTSLVNDPLAKDLTALVENCVYRGTPGPVYYGKVGADRVAAWKKGAEEGSLAGMILYGECLGAGVGVAKDERAAEALFRKAADAGSPGGMNDLGGMYSRGQGGLRKDLTEALRLYTRAAELGWARSMMNAGSIYLDPKYPLKDDKKAAEWFQKGAKGGDAFAVFLLADFHLGGLGGLEKNPKKAAELYRRAVDLGVPHAMVAFGSLRLGNVAESGVEVDERDALRLFREASALEYVEADAWIGLMHLQGRGGLKMDPVEGMRVLKKAAASGSSGAADLLKALEKK